MEKPTTKNIPSSKAIIQIQWRNQKLYRQAKVKRIQHQQTSFTTNAKGTSIGRKETSNLNNIVHIWTAISKPHGNNKLQNYARYTHKKRKSNPNTTLKMVIKPQGKRTKQEGKKETYKNKPKTIKKTAMEHTYR